MDITIGLPNTVAGVTRDSLLEWSRRAEVKGFPGVASLDRLVYPGYDGPPRDRRELHGHRTSGLVTRESPASRRAAD